MKSYSVVLGASDKTADDDMRKVLNFEVELVNEFKLIRNNTKLLIIFNNSFTQRNYRVE